MAISKTEFLETVKKARVLSPEQLNQWEKHNSADGVQIANQMVRDQALTEWQAKYLLTGRYQLELGNYRLLQRIQRDELGDRFLAVHKQLDRKVEIHVLAANLTNDSARLKSFIDRVGQTSVLDHPNLGHVYDIDQTGGRYYLVTEHVDGKFLGEMAGDEIDTSSVATWFQQSLIGLEYAHSSGIIHGDLTVDDLVIDDEHGIKVLNLAMTDLRSHFRRDRAPTPLDDLRILSNLFNNLLNRVSANDHAGRAQLKEIIEEVGYLSGNEKQTIKNALQQLDHWLSEFATASPTHGLRSTLAGMEENRSDEFEEFVSKSPSEQNRLLGPSLGLDRSEIDAREEQDDEHEEDFPPVPGRFERMALENPVGLLSMAFAIGVLASSAVTYAIVGAVAPRNSVQLADATPSISQSERPKRNPVGSARKTTPAARRDNNPDGQMLVSNETQNPRETLALDSSDESPDEKSTPSTNTTASQNRIESNGQTQTISEPGNLKTMREAQSGDGLSTGNETPAMPSDVAVPENLPTPDTVAKVPPGEPEAKPTETAASLTPEEFEKRTENPFGYLPKQVALPDIESSEPTKLAEVFISNRYLLGAELVTSEAISSSKVHFNAERDPADNQRWLIGIGRTANDRKTPIAAVQKREHEIFFEWLPEAKRNKQAGYLQNCLLKLFTPDQSAVLALRGPVEIEALTLSNEKLSAETQFDLEFLPSNDTLVIEVITAKIDDIRLSPSVIDLTMGVPGRVLLKREDDKPLVWVNLALELKPKGKLRADLVVFEGARVRPLKDLQELQTLANQEKAWEEHWTVQHQIALDTPAQPGKSAERRSNISELSKRKNLAKSNATKLIDYVERAPKMMNQPYGIRILARYDGYELELAKTKIDN